VEADAAPCCGAAAPIRAPNGAVAGVTGLEPAASGVTGRRSNQLSYTPAAFGRGGHSYRCPKGVSREGWSRPGLVGDEGFEPPTPSV
jgi:hypothetical protein